MFCFRVLYFTNCFTKLTDISLGILRNSKFESLYTYIHTQSKYYTIHELINSLYLSPIGEAGNTGQDNGGDDHQDEH